MTEQEKVVMLSRVVGVSVESRDHGGTVSLTVKFERKDCSGESNIKMLPWRNYVLIEQHDLADTVVQKLRDLANSIENNCMVKRVGQ